MSKENKLNILDREEEPSESFDGSYSSELSSELPSLTSDVTLPSSQHIVPRQCKTESESLLNLLSNSSPFDDGNLSIKTDPCVWFESTSDESESDGTSYEVGCSSLVPLLVDPNGWIKYSSDPDPWNKENYSEDESFPNGADQLTREIVAECSFKIDHLPDTKAFVLTRLHLNNKGLEDISVLSDYKYFHYIDLSQNFLANLEALSNSGYLMYLNASNNKLNSVLDFKPPWFLTHVNLSCNEIKEIGPHISNFWSLRHVDLSYNFIEKIEGLGNLKYLKYLDLSHNYIKVLENIDCPNLEQIFLQSNMISECLECEESTTNNLKYVKELKLANNRISKLSVFKTLYSIEDLDLRGNCINELTELGHLVGLSPRFNKLNLTENPVCSSIGYREFIIFKIPSLRVLDCVPILCEERVASRMLLGADLMTGAQRLRATVELWHQLSVGVGEVEEVGADTTPADQPPIPLLLLVGVLGCLRHEVSVRLANKYPEQTYLCKKYTTMPIESVKVYDPANLISISIDEFNDSIKSGKFLVHYKEVGCFFAIGREEICNCILESKIGIIDTIFEAAVTLRLAGLRPYMVLNIFNDITNFEERLRNHYQEMELWSSNPRYMSEEEVSDEGISLKSEESHFTEVTSLLPPQSDTAYIHKPILRIDSSYSFNKNYEPFNSLSIASKSKTITWDLDDSSEEQTSAKIFPSGSNIDKIDSDQAEEESDRWTWSLDSTLETVETKPSERYLNMIRGREYFVQQSLKQQDMYVQLNNEQPGLFMTVVITDDVDIAVKSLGKVCHELFYNWKKHKYSENPVKNSVYGEFVQDRVNNLLNELNEVSPKPC